MNSIMAVISLNLMYRQTSSSRSKYFQAVSKHYSRVSMKSRTLQKNLTESRDDCLQFALKHKTHAQIFKKKYNLFVTGIIHRYSGLTEYLREKFRAECVDK